MAKNPFKILKKYRDRQRAALKIMRKCSDEELVALAIKEDDFLPVPYKKTIKQKAGRKYTKKRWLEQNGIIKGATKVDGRTLKYALFKSNLAPTVIEHTIRDLLTNNYNSKFKCYNLKIDFFIPFIDGQNIIKFGDRVVMSNSAYKVFKEEYDKALKREKEEKTTKKI